MSSAQIKSKTTLPQTGQGILEVIVTIAIGTILILALVVLSVRTNRSSDFSKANSVASNLAAEGMEIIKNLKAINGVNGGTELFRLASGACSGSAFAVDEKNWSEIFSTNILDGSCPAGISGRVGYIVTTAPCPNGTNCLYFSDSNSASADINVDNRTYSRRIYVADTPPGDTPSGRSNCNTNIPADPNYLNDWDNIKQFTVEVTFTDSAGTHKSSQSSCITR